MLRIFNVNKISKGSRITHSHIHTIRVGGIILIYLMIILTTSKIYQNKGRHKRKKEDERKQFQSFKNEVTGLMQPLRILKIRLGS